MYRYWAPWDRVGVRDDLVALLATGRVEPETHPRSIDLGCGTGANVVYLAQRGFQSFGVDFSPVALRKGAERARKAGVGERCVFARGDLTADAIPGVEGPFDLLIDFGTLDDLGRVGRRAMASTIVRLSRPGSLFLLWCFFSELADLPKFSVSGPSRLAPGIQAGEALELFGNAFEIEPFSRPSPTTASFLLRRK